jgi:hypothetical protein
MKSKIIDANRIVKKVDTMVNRVDADKIMVNRIDVSGGITE